MNCLRVEAPLMMLKPQVHSEPNDLIKDENPMVAAARECHTMCFLAQIRAFNIKAINIKINTEINLLLSICYEA